MSYWRESADDAWLLVRGDESQAKGVADAVPIARKHAANLCDGCPVIEQCRWYALEAGEDDGVWGGLCEADRSTLRRGSSWRSRLHARSLYAADLPHGPTEDGGDAA